MLNNPFPYSNDNKRYHTLYYHNLKAFGGRVYKAVIDAGFSCPNIDGKCGAKGLHGCIFCDGGSGYFTESPYISVTAQLDKEIERISAKDESAKIIAYFQAHTNTYGSASRLKSVYEPVLASGKIVGISIGTRPDCLGYDVLEYLSEINARTNLTVELGLQTASDNTAEIINRGYRFDTFEKAFAALKTRGIRTCVHIINGLPKETEKDMLKTAEILGRLRPDGIKIQLLHVIRDTELHKMYARGEIAAMEKEDYIRISVKQLELLPAETVIERITGDGDKKKLVAPLWSTDKISVLGGIDKLQKELNSYQGLKFR